MSSSLRDQLIKSGLATAEQARKAERQARAEKHAQRHAPANPKAPAGVASAPSGTSKSAPGQVQPTEPDSATSPPSAAQSTARERARRLNAEKAARDRAAQRAVNDRAAEKALRAELKQLIHRNDQRTKVASDDDVPYNFLHGKKVKRIYITRDQQMALSSGSLVIVNDDGRYHLVSREIAERVRARDPKRIIAAHADQTDAPPQPGSDDEFYARFKVPDDLDW